MPSELISWLVDAGYLDLYLIDSPPATMSTALERALGESPTIDAVFHEPATGLCHVNQLEFPEMVWEEILDHIIGLAVDIMGERREKQSKASIIIKTMANDLSPEQYRFLLGLAKGAVTLVRNPQSQLLSFYKSYCALNESVSFEGNRYKIARVLSPVFGDKIKDPAFQDKIIGHCKGAFAEYFNLLQLSFYGVETDEPAWGSLHDHLRVLDGGDIDTPHMTLQSELLAHRGLMPDSIQRVCDLWGIETCANMFAEHGDDGPDHWAKTAQGIMRSGHERDGLGRADPFAQKAFASKGWRFKDMTVPNADSMPDALIQYMNQTAYPVYFACLDRDDMYGPKDPNMLLAVYGEQFREVATKMADRVRTPQPKGQNLTYFVDEQMFNDPAIHDVFRDLGL